MGNGVHFFSRDTRILHDEINARMMLSGFGLVRLVLIQETIRTASAFGTDLSNRFDRNPTDQNHTKLSSVSCYRQRHDPRKRRIALLNRTAASPVTSIPRTTSLLTTEILTANKMPPN